MTTLTSHSLLATGLDAFQSPATRMMAWMVGLLIVAGVIWGIAALADLRQRPHKVQLKPILAKQLGSVFEEICDAQGLSAKQQQILREGAAALNLKTPALLFVDSSLLGTLASSDREDAGEFLKLAGLLFAAKAEYSDSEEAHSQRTNEAVTA
ncbi:MAG: hypothetical protein O3B13_10450 [Planctomycetota bacterium]|nr:hypothetical protein [Planctomycetota bacterium]MDA1163513.1 hypothetical protein [Planctomycetota bacterium]